MPCQRRRPVGTSDRRPAPILWSTVEFRLLRTLEAEAGDRPVRLGRRRERLLLGILLLDAGKAVTVERLVDLLWTDNPAPAARATLHSHIARLRAVLAPHGVRTATRGLPTSPRSPRPRSTSTGSVITSSGRGS